MSPAIEDGLTAGISWRAAGPRTAVPVIFLHGIGGGARAFDGQLSALSDRYRAMAWDAPGYGGSPAPAEASIAAQAHRLGVWLAALGCERPVLVGHSIGGMIVQEALAANAVDTRAAVLVATSPAFGKSDGKWQSDFVRARFEPLERGKTMATMAPGLVEHLVGPACTPDGRARAVSCMAAVPEATYRAAVHSLLGFDRRAALPSIKVPVLAISGAVDTQAPPDMMQKMAGKIPGASYVCLDGAGHLPNLEVPDTFNAALRAFLDTLPAKATP
jgi:3-oxoadipate enol-lactonase